MSYRVGIIGCGGMGRSHASAWTQREDTTVVAAMDISIEAAQRLAEEYAVAATYTDYEEMLAKEEEAAEDISQAQYFTRLKGEQK